MCVEFMLDCTAPLSVTLKSLWCQCNQRSSYDNMSAVTTAVGFAPALVQADKVQNFQIPIDLDLDRCRLMSISLQPPVSNGHCQNNARIEEQI
jgi:hypothetical protein